VATTKEVFPEIFGNLSFKGGAVVQLQEVEAEAKAKAAAAAAANLELWSILMSAMRLKEEVRLHDMRSKCRRLELTKNDCGPFLILGFLFLLTTTTTITSS
jgi:hypothetical protein